MSRCTVGSIFAITANLLILLWICLSQTELGLFQSDRKPFFN